MAYQQSAAYPVPVGSWMDCKASHHHPLPMFLNTLVILIATLVLRYTDHVIIVSTVAILRCAVYGGDWKTFLVQN
jgi:hypothetical protein